MSPRRDDVVPARAPWSGIVPAGGILSLVDLHGNQAVDCLLYVAADTTERYSAPDTVARQGSIFLTTGSELRSNHGRVLLTVIADDGRQKAFPVMAYNGLRHLAAVSPEMQTA